MGDRTGIAWTDHTFNPWWGCTKVSPGCDHCYAERDAKRFHPSVVLWDAGSERRTFGEKHWNAPVRWDRVAGIAHRSWDDGVQRYGRGDEPGLIALGFTKPTRPRVFCASMADVFDNHPTAEATRPRLWQLIRETPFLDWQILTKRIGNAARMLPADWGNGYPNVWLGSSVVNQEEADRDIPKLLQTPAAVRFLSCEPLLGAIDLWPVIENQTCMRCGMTQAHRGQCSKCASLASKRCLHWVIIGGESGPKARPFDIQWARDIIAQCKAAGVACFMKQLGARPYDSAATLGNGECVDSMVARMHDSIHDRAGADPAEWPEDLRVRNFPEAHA